jgi:hypothetical protein
MLDVMNVLVMSVLGYDSEIILNANYPRKKESL